ncbi:hypothetical protein ACFWXK_06455 [Streptomyces sp. NPDC059070]|uniref:hypothetical protein n=1 Tax=unclassified Streptomyces TaxID=2593676 RepID=UPI0034E27CC8
MSAFTPRQLRDADRRAEEMAFPRRQLEVARAQAEGYRNFLASLTGLLTTVFVLKGQENLSKLPHGHRMWVVALLITGFAALITASWLAVSAVHGRPGETLVLGATPVLHYEVARTRRIWVLVEWARWLALAGVVSVAGAVVVTWLAPAAKG